MMVARINTINPSNMENSKAEKENHLIEAIVFTTDFLSCNNKKTSRGSHWICGSGDAETYGPTSSSLSDNSNDEDGWFGVKRNQLISYKNAEDLTRKVDALFHRKRTPLSSDAAFEIRDDDLVEEEEDFYYDSCEEEEQHHHKGHRSNRDATSTCPSTNASLSQEELNHWYSSSWSSFTYYGSNKESYGVNPEKLLSPTTATTTMRRDLTSRKQDALFPFTEPKRQQSNSSNSRSSSSLPDFLKGVEFNYHHHHRQKLSVIALPPSPPTSFSSPSEWHRPTVPSSEAACSPVESENKNGNQEARTRTMDSRGFESDKKKGTGSRRLGQKTKHYWEKAKRFLRR
jgi:hypothetical protein